LKKLSTRKKGRKKIVLKNRKYIANSTKTRKEKEEREAFYKGEASVVGASYTI